MAKRSKVYELPPEMREELNERLVSSGFQGYQELSEWLGERGIQISRSSVQRYGQDLQEEFELAMGNVRRTTEMAKALADTIDDPEGNLIGSTAAIVQDQLLKITMAISNAEHEPEDAAKHLSKVTRALADIGRLSLGQKKHAREIRAEAFREAADKATEVAKRGGLSEEMVTNLRKELLGIA